MARWFPGYRVMIISISGDAGDVMLDALSKMLDGGTLELLSEGGDVLAMLALSDPAARPRAAASSRSTRLPMAWRWRPALRLLHWRARRMASKFFRVMLVTRVPM